MASKTASRAAPAPSRPIFEETFDFGDDDSVFGSPSREDNGKTGGAGTKRKGAAAELGIDEEVSVQKRARVPNVKLDDAK